MNASQCGIAMVMDPNQSWATTISISLMRIKGNKECHTFYFLSTNDLGLFICNYRTLWQFGITWDCVLYFSPPFLHSSSSMHKRTSTNIIDPFFLLGTTNSINTIPNLPSRWLLIYNPLSCCLKVPYMSSKYLGIGITYKHLW